jgi:uncharacterized SAM-binding protein YcdF (DUF218 family)
MRRIFTKKRLLIGAVFSVFLFVLFYGALCVYVASFLYASTSSTADAALVLGAKSFKGSQYNPCLVDRVKEAEKLYRDKKIGIMLFSGGTDTEDNKNEADTMARIAADHGIPQDVLLLERNATSTYENFVYSKKILDSNHLRTVIVVTEPFHIARARLLARTLGIDARFESAESSECWNRWKYLSRYFLKEPITIMYYVITGKISITAF